jgi:Ca2+/Na+ antiporter
MLVGARPFLAGLAARRGDAGISVGAILGSNVTDPVFSPGVGALVCLALYLPTFVLV